jgi:hypothetical protein
MSIDVSKADDQPSHALNKPARRKAGDVRARDGLLELGTKPAQFCRHRMISMLCRQNCHHLSIARSEYVPNSVPLAAFANGWCVIYRSFLPRSKFVVRSARSVCIDADAASCGATPLVAVG